MITVYYRAKTKGLRTVKTFLEENKIAYVLQDVTEKPFTANEIKTFCELPVELEDKGIEKILKRTVNVEELFEENQTIKECFSFLAEHPEHLKLPIVYKKDTNSYTNSTQNLELLIPKSQRKKQLQSMLSKEKRQKMKKMKKVS